MNYGRTAWASFGASSHAHKDEDQNLNLTRLFWLGVFFGRSARMNILGRGNGALGEKERVREKVRYIERGRDRE